MAASDLRLLPAGEMQKSIHPALVPVGSSSIGRLTRPAPEGEGSSRLDRDRAASVADERGASALRFEARDTGPDGLVADDDRKRVLAALLVLGALVIWILLLND